MQSNLKSLVEEKLKDQRKRNTEQAGHQGVNQVGVRLQHGIHLEPSTPSARGRARLDGRPLPQHRQGWTFDTPDASLLRTMPASVDLFRGEDYQDVLA